MNSKTTLAKIAQNIRYNVIKVLNPGSSHHIGCSLDIIELLTYLYFHELKIDPKNPRSDKRDMFILSKGHAGIALFSTLAHRGFFGKKILEGYDLDGGTLPEHVTTIVPGVELSTGSLGHGLPVAAGIALDFQATKSKRRAVVLLSDGELDEGSNWEAIMFSGHHKLANLIVIVDLNGFQGYGQTKEIINLEPLDAKLKLFGWKTHAIDGHDFGQMAKVFKSISEDKSGKPTMIFAKTIKGKGIPHFEGKFESHYNSIDQATKDKILGEMEECE